MLGRAAEQKGDFERALDGLPQGLLRTAAERRRRRCTGCHLATPDVRSASRRDKVKLRSRTRRGAVQRQSAGRRRAPRFEPLARVMRRRRRETGRAPTRRVRLLPRSLPRRPRQRSHRSLTTARDEDEARLLSPERDPRSRRPGHLRAALALNWSTTSRRARGPRRRSTISRRITFATMTKTRRTVSSASMAANFPRGRYGERVAWRIGWRAYRQGSYREAAETFERAAAAFPRADNRPGWLYWSARARDLLNESTHRRSSATRSSSPTTKTPTTAGSRGRRSAGVGRCRRPSCPLALATSGGLVDADPLPTDALIRELVSLQLYDDALREVQYAQRQWGDSPQLQATTAFIRHNQGLTLARRGAVQRRSRCHHHDAPRVSAVHGRRWREDLPAEVLRIIFPLDYWPLITKYSKLHNLDPYLVAALMAQESTFTAEIRSSANAYGLMQLIPSTGSRYAKKLGIRNFSTADADRSGDQHPAGHRVLQGPDGAIRRRALRAGRLQRRRGARAAAGSTSVRRCRPTSSPTTFRSPRRRRT